MFSLTRQVSIREPSLTTWRPLTVQRELRRRGCSAPTGAHTRRERSGEMSEDYGTGTRPVSGWAIGGTVFAGVIMILIGSFHAIMGLGAIIDDKFFVVGNDYTFQFDTTAWGWIHLLFGILIVLAGAYIFS